MTKQSDRACPYCEVENWWGGWDSDGLWIASAHTGQWPLVELRDVGGDACITMIDECQNCGAVVSL
jgi:hypothetical protein